MQDLSLYVLDIVQNSIRANATCIRICVKENIKENLLTLEIEDNGCGIDDHIKATITDPFTTTRTLRKVGLGIPFLDQMCQETEGTLKIESEKGKGTKIVAAMKYDHIDRLPLGAIEKTMGMLILAKSDIQYIYEHHYQEQFFVFDTQEIQKVLDGVPINDLEIINWIENYIKSNINKISLITN